MKDTKSKWIVGVTDDQLHEEINESKQLRYAHFCRIINCGQKIRQLRNDESFTHWAIRLKKRKKPESRKKKDLVFINGSHGLYNAEDTKLNYSDNCMFSARTMVLQ